MTYAQKKQINQARDLMKEGKDYAKVEKLMMELLRDSANMNDTRIWHLLNQSLIAQYEQGNEKLYLKQTYDTTSFFNITKRMFITFERYDSIDARPDKHGKVNPKDRQRNGSYLHSIRPNLFNGGAFYIARRDYSAALSYFEQYLDCARQPLFASYQYEKTDIYLPQAAYWAMFCCYRLSLADDVLSYRQLAEQDSVHLPFTINYEAEASLQKGDTLQYVNALKKGFKSYPKFPYFFPRLVEYYGHVNQYDSALVVVEEALKIDSACVLFRFAKSTVLLNTGHDDACIEICRSLIADADTFADAYYNIGLAYFNKAIRLEKERMNKNLTVRQRQKTRAEINSFYEQSRPYLEHYRKLAPGQVSKWATPLYTIYLNLNMGKEFDEIDKIRNEYRKNIR